MKRILLVRHGESEWNASRLLQGQADIDLSPNGERQAEALRATLASLAPDRIVVSSLRRARRTAALLGYPDAEPTDELREIHVGDWAGERIADLVSRDPAAYRGWRAGAHTPPAGEDWREFKARTGACIERLLESDADRILVISHGGVVRAILENLIALSPERIVPVAPGSLTILQHDTLDGHAEARLELFNFAPGGPTFDAPD